MDGAEQEQLNFPEWTECQKRSGLDPLGMQNSSISLYQTFLPGISNVTLRIRYSGLYAWLCGAYAARVGDTNPETWKRYVRCTEALYALIACRRGGERGVAGIDWATKKLNGATDETIEFGLDAEPGSDTHYLQQQWGAYGAAYGSQLFETGILANAGGHAVPVLTEEMGDPLASDFEDAMGPLANRFHDAIERGSVSLSELDDFAELAPSEIDAAGAERARYQGILLNESLSKEAATLSRRLSILLILKIAGLLGREPKPEDVRWILYAGQDREGRTLDLATSALEAQRRRWRVYHANDLCHIAMETLLKFALDQLGRFPTGTSFQRLIPLCVGEIRDAADFWPEDWHSLLQQLTLATNAYAKDNPGAEWALSDDVVRGAGRNDERFCSPDLAWKAVKLLAIIHKRSQAFRRDIVAELDHLNPDAFRSLLSETSYLDQNLKKPFGDILEGIIEERVIRRHLWVALRKFRHQKDYTFLIEIDEGRARLREKDGPVFTNPRLGPAITFLKDIHLVGGQGLTDLGAKAAGPA